MSQEPLANRTSSGGQSQSVVLHVVRAVIATLVLILAGFGAWAYLHFTAGKPKPEHAGMMGGGRAIPVSVMKMEPQTVPVEPSFLGQTSASRVVEIRARVKGFLQSRDFVEGTQVKKGQLLFKIDPRQFQADLQAAQSELDSDKAHLMRAREQLKRYQKLVSESAATASELENWQTQTDVARANIEHDKAMIAQANLNLGYTDVTSPMRGMIGRTKKNVGAYVDDLSNSLLAVVRKVDPIYVSYSMSESELLRWQQRIKNGVLKLPADGKLHVSLTLADGTKYDHEGTVDFVDVRVNPSTGTALVRAVFPNPDHVLRPGAYVRARILGVNQTNTLLVPQDAVLQTPSGASVYTVDAKGKVEQHEVTRGQMYKGAFIVKSGLKPGDLVLTNHLMTVRPGMKVKPTVHPEPSYASNQGAARPDASSGNGAATQASAKKDSKND